MFDVVIKSSDKEISVNCQEGALVSEVLKTAGIQIMMPCGGTGRCGKCKVRIEGSVSAPGEAEKSLLYREDLENGMRLACETKVMGNAVIHVEEKKSRILTEGIARNGSVSECEIEILTINVESSSLEKQQDEFKKTFGKLGFLTTARPELLRCLHDAIKRSEDNKIYAVVNRSKNKVLAVYPYRPKPVYAAIDIGTTTIAAYLVEPFEGNILEAASALNPQGKYGADVISRIDAALEKGTEELRDCVAEACDKLIDQMLKKHGIGKDEVIAIRLVGNTVMMHLAACVSPENIAFSPFIPVFTASTADHAVIYHMNYRFAVLETGPCISAYVGADTTAALIACGMHESDRISLLIDIGTNGEIVLGNKDGMVCCSAAAGPAFEGAHIQCGSGAVSGAVSGVTIDSEGKCTISTIDDVKAVSICGSGLVDAVAEMYRTEIIDETGRIEPESQDIEDMLFETVGGTAFPITEDKRVYICQKDIREVQLAKSAIAAGIRILMEELHISFDDIDTLYLAGGFGNYINVHNACVIGLLPTELEKKTKAVGNAAGTGAVICVSDREVKKQCDLVSEKIRYIELSSDKRFSELFAENMLFED